MDSLGTFTYLFVGSILVGLAITVLPGPVGALCVGRTIRHGLLHGLLTAAGAVAADTLYGAAAAFGLAVVSGFVATFSRYLAAVVTPFLVVLGLRFIHRARVQHRMGVHRLGVDGEEPSEGATPAPGLFGTAASSFLLTLGTPGTLPALIATFTFLGLAERMTAGMSDSLIVVAGVFVGAAGWWLALCLTVFRMRKKALVLLPLMDYAAGVLLLVAAVVALRMALG